MWTALGAGAAAVVVAAVTWLVAARPLRRTLVALELGISDLEDGDFSRRLVDVGGAERRRVVQLYNRMADVLRSERRRLIERELLLESVLAQDPTAIVLRGADGRVAYANRAAETLLASGYTMAGKSLAELAEAWPAIVRDAFAREAEDVITLPGASGEVETFHLAVRQFTVSGRAHVLYIVRRLTPELRRHEVATWKRVIRTISHEINNTLAPISSLAHSAKLMRAKPAAAGRLDELLDTIADSATRLTDFIGGYARFARLPEPNRRLVEWSGFLAELVEVAPVGRCVVASGATGSFDPAQMQQVLVNLIVNATEAGSAVDDIELRVELLTDGRTLIRVLDRGRGMSQDVRDNALLPFYSTKREGSGLGLALCREIVEAHGGGIELADRDGGGTVASAWLPATA